jgi:alkylated DNA repair protein alkB family protein 1
MWPLTIARRWPSREYLVSNYTPSTTLEFTKTPGLVILPGFLSHTKQRELIRWSLSQHAISPNETNLDTHYVLPEDGLWNAHLRAFKDPQRDFLVQPKASTPSPSLDQTPPGPRQLINNTAASPGTFETISTTPKPPAAPSPSVLPASVSSLIYKLRWANIGWHYHWGTKQYDFSKGPGVIDAELKSICKDAVRSVDWSKVHGSQDPGWGPGGPDWNTWDESYGTSESILEARLHVLCRT